MMTFAELKEQLIAKGVPAEVADTVAAGKLAEMMTTNSKTIREERSAVITGTNKNGLPAVLRKGAKGSLVPCCETRMAVLLPAAESKKTKAEFGPSIVLHFAEHLNERGYIAPQDIWIGGQSSASIVGPEQSGAWQFAEMIANSLDDVRYFVRYDDKSDAEELPREEWLEEVYNQCREFADDVKTVRDSSGRARRR